MKGCRWSEWGVLSLTTEPSLSDFTSEANFNVGYTTKYLMNV